PSIRRYGKCSKPVPFVGINRIVIDSLRCAEGQATVRAANKHHVGCAVPGRQHAGQHVNVVVSFIDRQKGLTTKSYPVYSTLNQVATHVDGRALVKPWRLSRDLGIARTLAKEGGSFPTDKQVTVGVYVECSKHGPVRNSDWRLPGNATVDGTLEL